MIELLAACREAGIGAAVDTSGYAPQDLVLEAASYGPIFLYDLKLMDEARHKAATGVSNEPSCATCAPSPRRAPTSGSGCP